MNAAGCDSLTTLNLTIKQPTTSSVTQTAMGSYSWNGTTYSTSGTYTVHLINAAGCDSTATLVLSITPTCVPTFSSLSVNSCVSYTWHGHTYSASGSYTYTTTNSTGCDSIITLNLHLKSQADVVTITGVNNTCVDGKSSQFTSNFTGGVWSTNSTSIIVNSNGKVTGIGESNALATIKYVCANDSATTQFSYLPFTIIGSKPIIGASSVCTGSTIQLQTNVLTYAQNIQNGATGLWSVQNPNRGSIDQNGLLTAGAAGGRPIVWYTLTNKLGCSRILYDTLIVINPLPTAKATISGATSVCTNSSVQLSATIAGSSNTWGVQNPARGTITNGGLLTGAAASANAIVTYKYTDANGCTSPTTYYDVQVNPLPARAIVSGATAVCSNSSVQLSTSVAGASNVWSVQNPTRGSITNNGLLTGAAPNANAIVMYSYTDNNGCTSPITYYNVQVNPLPAIAPHITTLSGTYCVGSSYNFAATPVGGTWSTNNAIASISSSNTSAATAKINSAGSFGIIYKTAADVNGCKATTTFIRSTSNCTSSNVVLDTLQHTAESARVQSASVSVYPNPARGVVTLNSPSVDANSSLSIADITGKIVKTQAITDKQTKVNVSNLTSGIYFISIQSAEGKTTKKLIINN